MRIERVQEGQMAEPEYTITLSVWEMLELVGVAYHAKEAPAPKDPTGQYELEDSKVAGFWWHALGEASRQDGSRYSDYNKHLGSGRISVLERAP